MKKFIAKRVVPGGLLIALFVTLPNAAHACAVCFGAADSSQTAGMNMAMFTLLGVTGTVFCGICACIFNFRRRILAIEREAEALAANATHEAKHAPSDESLREDALVE